jgi:hypothetical protein
MQGNIIKITWDTIRQEVAAVNPVFAKLIDDLSPGKEFCLYKVSYPFGATVLSRGLFHLPLDSGEIVPITDPRISEEFRSEFAYAKTALPLGIALKNAYELFIDMPQYTLPIVAVSPGSIFALWKQLEASPTFHPTSIFNIFAGARSLFMLPNIGNFMSHKNLARDFNISSKQSPAELLDHWQIFKSIAEHEKCDWRLELLLVPGNWLEKAMTDPAWSKLYLFLLEQAWTTSSYERNQIFYEFALSCIQANRNLKPNPYLLDTVRHLLSITLGATPGFKPATDELMAPISLIQRAYVESYRLKEQAPILLQPAHFNIHDPSSSSVYYSLQFPTTISFSPRSRQFTNTLYDLRELKHIIDIMMQEISARKVYLEDTIMDMIPQQVQYDFFHIKADPIEGILPTIDMVAKDPDLLKMLYAKSSKEYSGTGSFVRGCMRIGHKNE